jgi:peptidoglycan DL-endopeptidase CwlO
MPSFVMRCCCRESHKVRVSRPGLWYGPATVDGRTTGSAARLAGFLAVLALAAGSTAAAAGPGTGDRQKAAQLRVQTDRLGTREHRALLDLYALDSRLSAARRRLAALTARSAALRRRQATLAAELTAARQTLAVSQQELGDHLRNLYEEGRPDPLAVVLGARSLDDAVSKLDTLTRLADQSRHVVTATRSAQTRLIRVRSRLASQRRRLDASLAAARSVEQTLTDTRQARTAFVRGLQAQQRLQESRILTLLTAAHAAERKAQQIQASAAAPALTDATGPAPAAATAAAASESPAGGRGAGTRTLRVSATAYSLPGHTATGMPVGWGVVAVDPSVIPLGTRLSVPGYGEAIAADVGSAVRGAMIDLWFPTLAQARAWGRRTVTITLH